MPALTIRNLSAETHRALKVRAARHGRSTEAEVRDILERTAMPTSRIRLGSLLAGLGREAGLSADEAEAFKAAIKREEAAREPIPFDR